MAFRLLDCDYPESFFIEGAKAIRFNDSVKLGPQPVIGIDTPTFIWKGPVNQSTMFPLSRQNDLTAYWIGAYDDDGTPYVLAYRMVRRFAFRNLVGVQSARAYVVPGLRGLGLSSVLMRAAAQGTPLLSDDEGMTNAAYKAWTNARGYTQLYYDVDAKSFARKSDVPLGEIFSRKAGAKRWLIVLKPKRLGDPISGSLKCGERQMTKIANFSSRFFALVDPFLIALLFGIGLWFAIHQPFGLDKAPAGSLAGALIAGAAVLLGNAINRANMRIQSSEDKAHRELQEAAESDRRIRRVKAIVTAELVNQAAGLMSTKKFIDAAILTSRANGAPVLAPGLEIHKPRSMPMISELQDAILELNESSIDALATLRANLEITSRELEDVTVGAPLFETTSARISNGLGFNLELLAVAFERIAPARMLQFHDAQPGQEPALAAVVLRRAARPPI